MIENIAVLLLATGEKSTDGGTLLDLVDGQDRITRATQCACSTGAAVYVTIATDKMELAQAIASEPVTIVPVSTKKAGISGALSAGIKSLPKGLDGVLVMLASIGALTNNDLSILLTHFAELGSNRVVCGTDETGHPGYPLILPTRYFQKTGKLTPNQSLLRLLTHRNVSPVRLEPGHSRTDLDRPEDWIAWRTIPPGPQNH